MKLRNVFRLNKQSIKYQFIQKTIETEEISVLGIIKYLLSFWKWLVPFILVFTIFGAMTAGGAKYFVAKTIIIPDGSGPPKMNLPGGLGDLIQSAPVSSGSLGIESFPGVLASSPFLLDLLDEEIFSEQYQDYVKLSIYLQGINTSSAIDRSIAKLRSLPMKLIDQLFTANDDFDTSSSEAPRVVDTLAQLSAMEISLMKNLEGRIKVDGANSITIETTMPEANVSVRLNNLVLEKLVDEVVKLKTAKEQRNLKYIEKQLDTARTKFLISQKALANFRDRNQGNNSANLLTEQEILGSDYSLYFGIYSGLASELETTKIELLKKTPLYSVYEPAYVPLTASGGFNLFSIVKMSIIGALLGVLTAIGYSAFVIFLIFKGKLKETEI